MKRYNRRKFLKTSLVNTAGAFISLKLGGSDISSSPPQELGMLKSPNLLFIFCDQLRYTALGSSGNEVVKTPTIDNFAEEGVVFDNTFSNCPVCSPFRGQLLTGIYSHKNGAVDNEYELRTDLVTFPQVLKKAGYRTGFVGKWHLGYGPYTEAKRHGFDYLAAHNCLHEYYKMEYYENEEGPIKMEQWSPEGMTSISIKFMGDHQKTYGDKPFALFLAWGPPHYPYDQYPDKYNIYDPEKVDLPPNVPVELKPYAKGILAHYYGNMTALDDQMKRILRFLNQSGLTENTIVCFSSDHGEHMFSHGYIEPTYPNWRWMHPSLRASKGTPFDESIHIPFILRWPNQIAGNRRASTMLGSVDMMPTLLGLMDLDIPEGVQGLDLSHAIKGEKGPEPDSIYLQILGPGWPHRGKWVGFWRGVKTHRYVYARWHADEYEAKLFDRKKDPYEMNNLLYRNLYEKDPPEGWENTLALKKEMEELLQEWMKKTDDPFDTGERDPKTGMLLLGQKFTHDKYKW